MAKTQKVEFSSRTSYFLRLLVWIGGFAPLLGISALLIFQSEDNLPSIEVLENPSELLASVVYADDGETELGRYWKVNRTTSSYNDISNYVFDALISTEDERFEEHTGIDFRALSRAVLKLGRAGGGSTITQQLAKLLFTLQQRERIEIARANGEDVSTGPGGMMGRINEKAQENIIATRLERRFTKEEIITMYLNQFDFLYNAVGIENAARVYFNKKPADLTKVEAATLVGMCKNPSLYNPYTYTIKDYRRSLAARQGVDMSTIKLEDISAARSADSLRMADRRNQVLYQWLRNSNSKNKALKSYITREEYEKLIKEPLKVDYQVVDHKQGMAPYFRESLRAELSEMFKAQDEKGRYIYRKADGSPYNIYKDGLKIYTTINVDLQGYAEVALEKHLKDELQPAFDQNNENLKRYPFSNSVSDKNVETIMNSGRKQSERYRVMKEQGYSEKEIEKAFNQKVPMKVFAWNGDIDTTMTPNDSIRYYKAFLHAGLVSIEPQTGFVKAWVGGANFTHFAYDHVRQGKRQVGSTIKPFVYSTAIAMGVVKPCTKFEDMPYCVDLVEPDGRVKGKWCPRGDIPVGKQVSWALANSNNPGTVAVMSMMGGYAGPKTIAKLLRDVDINIRPEDEVPSMCLGVMDLSLMEMTAAQAMFVNQGIFNSPTTILRIEDRNGNVIYNAEPKTKEVMNQYIAHTTLEMMRGTVLYGTAGSLRGGRKWGGITAPTAGKTGTTQNNSDGWFMGLTPELVTGVWVGAEDRAVRFKTMTWGQGARMALPIYGYYMQKVYADKKIGLSTRDFEVPLGYDPAMFSCEGDNQIIPDDKNPFNI